MFFYKMNQLIEAKRSSCSNSNRKVTIASRNEQKDGEKNSFFFLLEESFSFVVFIKEQIYGYSVNVLIMTKVLLVPEALAKGY